MSRNLQLSKPPPAPSSNGQAPNGQTGVKSGRVIMSYGSHRSATTSIVPSSNVTSTPSSGGNQVKLTQLQKQFNKQQQLTQQAPPQQRVNGTTTTTTTNMLPRTSTIQSIASSNSSSTIASYSSSSQANNTTHNHTINSSNTSISTSSSTQQITSYNASSPRSRNHSPSSSSSMMMTAQSSSNRPPQAPSSNNTTQNMISPSGLLTDGPLGRRPIVSASPMRDRSSSPGGGGPGSYETSNGRKNSGGPQLPQYTQQLNNQLNHGSNSSLHTIQETKIPASMISPMVGRKHQQPRKSFLPQPVTYGQLQQPQPQQQQQFQQYQQRQSSVSPIRY